MNPEGTNQRAGRPSRISLVRLSRIVTLALVLAGLLFLATAVIAARAAAPDPRVTPAAAS